MCRQFDSGPRHGVSRDLPVRGARHAHTSGVTTVYLADVGFRAAGVRLVAPVRAQAGKHAVTLGELIATPEGTDLTYYLTGLSGEEGYTPRQDVVGIESAGVEHVLTRGAFSFGSDRQRLRRRISSTSVIPPWTGPVAVAIAITGVGEFRLAAELRAFGPETDAPRRDVNTSAIHEGITVTVRGVGAAREETAIEIEVAVGEGECCAGIGGYRGHRLGPTAVSLSDESGRVYMERWQEPGRFDHATLALFQPLHPEARELELAVPYVFVEDAAATTETLSLPVTSPVETRLGHYGIRVLGTARVDGNPRARYATHQEPAIGVDLDLGGWHGDRRVLLPGRPLVDGDFCNVGYRLTGMMDAKRPEPVDRLEITGDRALAAKTLGFTRPSIQVRGPWRIRFSLI
jgi:hypothetical protein